jgi:hypothetical protein
MVNTQLQKNVSQFDYIIYFVSGLDGGNGGVRGRGGRVRISHNITQFTMNHEMAHTFGIIHSVWEETNDGEQTDLMGVEHNQLSTPWREYAGWLSPSSIISVNKANLASPLTITIKELMTSSKTDPIAIRYTRETQNDISIQFPDQTYKLGYLYIEFSRGFVAIRGVPILQREQQQFSMWLMKLLSRPGDSYVDQRGEGITITLVGISEGAATISIRKSDASPPDLNGVVPYNAPPYFPPRKIGKFSCLIVKVKTLTDVPDAEDSFIRDRFTAAAENIALNSYNQVKFECDLTSPFKVVDSKLPAGINGLNPYDGIYDELIEAQLGIDVSVYDYIIFFVNGLGKGANGGSDGQIRGGRIKVGHNCTQQTMNHELAHTFNIIHSVAENTDNGDTTDLMGTHLGQISSPFRDYIGWLSPSSVAVVENTFTSPQRFTIKDIMSSTQTDLIAVRYVKRNQDSIYIQTPAQPYKLGYLYVDFSNGIVTVRGVPILPKNREQYSIWVMDGGRLTRPNDNYVDKRGEGITITLESIDSAAKTATITITKS